MFKPHVNKMKSALYEARPSLKKRILTETNVNKHQNDKAKVIEPKNTKALIDISLKNYSGFLNYYKTCK